MHVVSALAPLASVAMDVASRQVTDAVQSSVAFVQLLKDRLPGNDTAGDAPRAKALAQQGPDATRLGGQVQRDALRQHLQSLQETVQRELLQRLAEQGVDLTEPAVLVADRQGRLLEVGGHWDRAQIEQTLAADKSLGDQVRQLLQQADACRQADLGTGESGESGTYRLVVGQGNVLLQVV